MSFIPCLSFGDDVGAREAEDNWEKVQGARECLPRYYWNPTNARGRHGDHGSRTSPAYSRDSLPELIGQEGPATEN